MATPLRKLVPLNLRIESSEARVNSLPLLGNSFLSNDLCLVEIFHSRLDVDVDSLFKLSCFLLINCATMGKG